MPDPRPIPILIAAAASLLLGTALVTAAVPSISVDEVSAGQKGYGLSVFDGTEPKRFEVEVIGIMHRSTPEISYILARLSGQDLERVGVIAGMSGSPVYFDDRLAGAVSFGFAFGMDPIAGITPIDAMRRMQAQPNGAPSSAMQATAAPTVSFESLVRRDFEPALLSTGLEGLTPQLQGLSGIDVQSGLQWNATGFGDEALTLLRGTVGTLGPGGNASTASDGGELLPGGAVAALLVDGDMRLAISGTVTERDGDAILAFGHPVFGVGPMAAPMATSEVLTVIANHSNSFKLSNSGAVIGAFEQDREAGLSGRLGRQAPSIPLEIRLRGLAERDYSMRIADLPRLNATLMSIAALGAINAGTYASAPQSIDMALRIRLADYEDLAVTQSFDGAQAATDSVLYLMAFATYLAQNPFEQVKIEGVDIELTQTPEPRLATLLAAHPVRTRVEPGDVVPVTLELQVYRGARLRRTVNVKVPARTPDGRYVLLLGDGTSMDAARLAIEHRDPENLEQGLEMMRGFHNREELLIFGLIPGPGLALAGEVMPQLPGSVRSILATGGTQTGTPLSLAVLATQTETFEQPLSGALRVDLEVRRRPR